MLPVGDLVVSMVDTGWTYAMDSLDQSSVLFRHAVMFMLSASLGFIDRDAEGASRLADVGGSTLANARSRSGNAAGARRICGDCRLFYVELWHQPFFPSDSTHLHSTLILGIHSTRTTTLLASDRSFLDNFATMLSAQPAKKAIQCLPRARRFSSTPAPAAVSPYRQTARTQTQQSTRRNVSDTAKRPAQAAAATSPRRAVPSPAFNRSDDSRLGNLHRLQPYRQPEMDHSFVGMKGGEIFHEMMLRQGVKHVCE